MTNSLDLRSVEELLEEALRPQWERAEPAIGALHRRGGREVLDAALALAADPDPFHRARAADILGQIGSPERHFPEECWQALAKLAQHDPMPMVVSRAAHSLQFIDDARSIPILLSLCHHPKRNIRRSVVRALGQFHDEGQEVTTALLELMQDPDDEVRDWATFGLGTLSEEDSPVIREAFLARVTDPHPDTRQEAIAGLAKRGDRRAIEPLIADLDEGISNWHQDAAADLLGLVCGSDLNDVEIEAIIDRLRALQQK
jgi:HEAT repeat protein